MFTFNSSRIYTFDTTELDFYTFLIEIIIFVYFVTIDINYKLNWAIRELSCVEVARKELQEEIERLRERHTNLERKYEIQSASLKEEKKITALYRVKIFTFWI